MRSGGQSEHGRIASLLLRHPAEAWISQRRIDAQWRQLGYRAPPDFRAACSEYDAMVRSLEPLVGEISWLPGDDGATLDAIYVRDACVVSDRGIVLCRMGKPARRGEPGAMADWLAGQWLGRISGEGLLEGGDLVWLGPKTAAVGLGYRSNAEGIAQLSSLLGNDTEVLQVSLPYWNGPGDVFHLMSMISPLAADLALVYQRLLPVTFREALIARSIKLIDVPDEEYRNLACNVLALGSRRCLMLAGNPATRRRIESAGCEVIEFQGDEICLKGEGGPTCLTRPLVRES